MCHGHGGHGWNTRLCTLVTSGSCSFCSLPSDGFPVRTPVGHFVMRPSRSGSFPSDRSSGDPRKGWKALESERAGTHPPILLPREKLCVVPGEEDRIFDETARHASGRENRSLRGGRAMRSHLPRGSLKVVRPQREVPHKDIGQCAPNLPPSSSLSGPERVLEGVGRVLRTPLVFLHICERGLDKIGPCARGVSWSHTTPAATWTSRGCLAGGKNPREPRR